MQSAARAGFGRAAQARKPPLEAIVDKFWRASGGAYFLSCFFVFACYKGARIV